MQDNNDTPPGNPLNLYYPQAHQNLDTIPVFSEKGDDFFEIKNLPDILSYGKHYFLISLKIPSDASYRLRRNSKIFFEFLDPKGNVIFSTFSTKHDLRTTNGQIVCYVWIREDLLRTHNDIYNGMGKLTVVGELESLNSNLPVQWQNKPNVRFTKSIQIKKELPNTSPILFDISIPSMSLSQSNHFDKNENDFYKRNYVIVSASNLETIGGQVSHGELLYSEQKTLDGNFKSISTFPVEWTIAQSASAISGANPPSVEYKIPIPRNLRRNSTTYF